MNLTPLDIRRKEFDKGFRGYDPTEVDLFLKQVAEQLEDIQEEARRAEEKTREAESKLVHYEKVELALQEALESARESARRSEASAEEKARLIVQEAELRAEQIVHDAERERYGLRQDVSKLSARQAEIAARLRGFLFSELEVLAQFQGDDPVGFIKLQPSGAQAALAPPPARLEAPIPDPEEPSAPDAPESETTASSPEPAPSPAEPAPAAPLAEPVGQPSAPEPPVPSRSEPSGASPELVQMPSEPAPSGAESTEPPVADDANTASSPDTSGAPKTPPAVTGGWDLRSLVTGEERNVAASDEEREAIRRILDDLD